MAIAPSLQGMVTVFVAVYSPSKAFKKPFLEPFLYSQTQTSSPQNISSQDISKNISSKNNNEF